MAHHYNSPCKQCYMFDTCKRIEERTKYIKEWKALGYPIGMSNHDCFKSPEEHARDIKNAQNQLK